jgi:hypothetical protein
MPNQNEKRSCERCACGTPILLTRFNTTNWFEGQTLNHCTEGMCVQSNFLLRPGTTVLIRMKENAPNGSRPYAYEGLPTIALGKVKWYRENPDATPSSYDLGIKYFTPAY